LVRASLKGSHPKSPLDGEMRKLCREAAAYM